MVAVFTVAALGTLGAGAIMGVETWVALAMAGVLAVASVAERLAREYLDDGKLTIEEMVVTGEDLVKHQTQESFKEENSSK